MNYIVRSPRRSARLAGDSQDTDHSRKGTGQLLPMKLIKSFTETGQLSGAALSSDCTPDIPKPTGHKSASRNWSQKSRD